MEDKIYPLIFQTGIQRDGTALAARSWIDGQWIRFQRSLPQKMGGYTQIASSTEIPRGTFVVGDFPNFNIYYGSASQLNFVTVDQFGNHISGPTNRTPVPFQANVNNDWQFDTMFSSTDNGAILIAYAAPNLAGINSNIDSPIYFGDLYGNGTLTPTGQFCSGGIAVFHPYLFFFGNDGELSITAANDPTTVIENARITSSKICFGIATRGGNTSPAGLLWSLDSLIRVTNIGTTEVEFSFDTITAESSLLSSRGIIEYDNQYYWAAVDRFLVYNGIVQELPNDQCLNYFFRNLNYSQRQKIWATKITQYGEIIWFFPAGNATECTNYVKFNVREKCWDSGLINRSDGYFDQVFAKPIWGDNTQHAGTYPIWMHEIGTDQVFLDGSSQPINSFITTPYISWLTTGPNGQRNDLSRWVDLYRVEPDMLQTGQMSLTVGGTEYARSTPTSSTPYVYQPSTVKIDLREQQREMTLTFDSNVLGGYFEFGQTLIVGRVGDLRE